MVDATAVAVPKGRAKNGSRKDDTMSFAELDADSSQIAAALRDLGVQPGTRMVLMVRPGIEFISLTFALFKAGVVVVLIDPGMGKEHMIKCLADVQPEGFVGIPLAQAARIIYRKHFPLAKTNVTVGRRWFWGGRIVLIWHGGGATGGAISISCGARTRGKLNNACSPHNVSVG